MAKTLSVAALCVASYGVLQVNAQGITDKTFGGFTPDESWHVVASFEGVTQSTTCRPEEATDLIFLSPGGCNPGDNGTMWKGQCVGDMWTVNMFATGDVTCSKDSQKFEMKGGECDAAEREKKMCYSQYAASEFAGAEGSFTIRLGMYNNADCTEDGYMGTSLLKENVCTKQNMSSSEKWVRTSSKGGSIYTYSTPDCSGTPTTSPGMVGDCWSGSDKDMKERHYVKFIELLEQTCDKPCSARQECDAGATCQYPPSCDVTTGACEGCCQRDVPTGPAVDADCASLAEAECVRNESCSYTPKEKCLTDICFGLPSADCERSDHCQFNFTRCVPSDQRRICRLEEQMCIASPVCDYNDEKGCIPKQGTQPACDKPCGGAAQTTCDGGLTCVMDPNCNSAVPCDGCCKDMQVTYPCALDLPAEECSKDRQCSYNMLLKECMPDMCFSLTGDDCERSEHCAMEGKQCVASAARMECRGSQDDCEKKTDCSWDDVKGCSPMGTMQPTCDKPCGGIAGIQCDTGLSCMYDPACNNMGGSADCMGCCKFNMTTNSSGVCPADLSAGDCMAKMACNYDVRDKACREDMCVRLSHEMCDKTDLCDLDGTRCVPSAARVMCRFEEDACTKMPECAWDAEKGCLPAQVDDVGKVCEGRAADECSDKVCRYDEDAKACAPRMCEFLGKDACAARKYCEYAQDMCRPATCFEAPTMCDDCDPEPAFGSPCVLLANGKPAKGMCTEDAAGAPVCEVMPTFDDDCATVECTVIGASCSDMDKTLNQRGAECLCPFGERNVSGICEANGGDGCSADEMMRCAMSHKTCKKEGTSEAKCVDMTCMDVAQCPDMPSADCTRTGKCPFPCAYTCPSVCTEEEERKCRFEMSASKLPYECRQGGKCETVPCEEVEYVTHFFHGHLLLL